MTKFLYTFPFTKRNKSCIHLVIESSIPMCSFNTIYIIYKYTSSFYSIKKKEAISRSSEINCSCRFIPHLIIRRFAARIRNTD